jgi:hypothetical protein
MFDGILRIRWVVYDVEMLFAVSDGALGIAYVGKASDNSNNIVLIPNPKNIQKRQIFYGLLVFSCTFAL